MIKDILKFLLLMIVFSLSLFFNSSVFYGFPWSLLLILLIVVAYNFFEKSDYFFGILIGFSAGLLIDIYSSGYFFGCYAISLSFLAISMKLLVNRYVSVF